METVRCWLIRGVILVGLAGGAVSAWMVNEYVSPERVRALLEAHLREKLPGADVQVGSARLRLFGGITATEVTVTRPGESEPFFHAPALVLAHDKEQLHSGRLVLKKVELDGPTVRVARLADGSWSLAGLLAPPGDPTAPLPILIVRNATVQFTDQRSEGLPPIVLAQATLHLLNDPPGVIRAEAGFTLRPGTGSSELAVPMTVSVRANRADPAFQVRLEVPDLAMTPDLVPAVERVAPGVGDYLTPLSAHVGVRAAAQRSAQGGPLTFDVKLDVRDGHYEAAEFPWPLEHVAGTIHYKDGRVAVEKATARFGAARVELAVESREIAEIISRGLNPDDDWDKQIDCTLDRLSLTLRGLPLTDELFAKLPESINRARQRFSPVGTADLTATATRTPAGLTQEVIFAPDKLSITYEKFQYPVHDLRGTVKWISTPDGAAEFTVGVDATAAGRPLTIVGRVGDDGPNPLIQMKLTGVDFPVDGKLMAALPPKYAEELADLHATGRADFTIDISQPKDVDRRESTFRVRIYDGSVTPERYPYPLSDISGWVVVRVAASHQPATAEAQLDTDRAELRDFRASHAGGRFTLTAVDEPTPHSQDRRRIVDVTAENIPLDAAAETTVSTLGGKELWTALAPKGTLSFAAHAEVANRPPESGTPFDPVHDLSVAVGFRGLTLVPPAFPFELGNVSGAAKYTGGRLLLDDLSARHGPTTLTAAAAEMRFPTGGGVWANIGAATIRPVPCTDPEFLAALPERIRTALRDLQLTGPVQVTARQIVTETKPDGTGANIYWKAETTLAGASFDTGIVWRDVHGAIASVGQCSNGVMGPVVGNVWFDQAVVANQPLSEVKAGFRVYPAGPDAQSPEVIRPLALAFTDVAAGLFRGTVGGEARVEFPDGPPRYRVWLTAAGVRLDELAAHWHPGSGADLTGLAQGRVLLENPPDPSTGLATLTGSGQLDIPNGRMLNLPVLLPLLKLLKLQAPDQTAFEEAHATFQVRGDQVRVTQLDLVGSAVSLGGSGELDTRGDEVTFEFYTIWSQALRRWLQSPLGDVAGALSGSLFRIDMAKARGGVMQYTPHMLPGVTEPVQAVAERLRNRLAPVVAPATYRAAPVR